MTPVQAVLLPPPFPDLEDTVSGYLADQTKLPAGNDVPDARPGAFYRVLRTGGGRTAPNRESPTLVIEGWNDNPADALDMTQAASDLIFAAVGTMDLGGHLYRVRAGSLAPLPDPSGQPRYTVTLQLDIGRTRRHD